MKEYFEKALHQASLAFNLDTVPVGAVLVYKKEIIAQHHNQISPLDHAEMLALKEGLQKIGPAIRDAVLYVTVEPCAMCTAAISLCGIKQIYFGAYNEKSVIDTNIQSYGGFYEKECGQILRDFFIKKR